VLNVKGQNFIEVLKMSISVCGPFVQRQHLVWTRSLFAYLSHRLGGSIFIIHSSFAYQNKGLFIHPSYRFHFSSVWCFCQGMEENFTYLKSTNFSSAKNIETIAWQSIHQKRFNRHPLPGGCVWQKSHLRQTFFGGSCHIFNPLSHFTKKTSAFFSKVTETFSVK